MKPCKPSKDIIKLSKTLTYYLRHHLIDHNIVCDAEGYVSIQELWDKQLITCTLEQIQEVVATSEKQRFALQQREDSLYYIKCNQGHSQQVGSMIDDTIALKQILIPYPHLYHGTFDKYVDSIQQNGLQRGERKHIHCVTSLQPDETISGFRDATNMIVDIDMKQCMEAGILFYESENHVILTEGINGMIPSTFFTIYKWPKEVTKRETKTKQEN